MKQIISKKTGKIQIISENTWDDIVSHGWQKRFDVTDLPEVRLKNIPEVPPEVKRKKKDEQNN